MDRNTTTTAVVTALLVAGAMLLGSVAFPRVEVRETPAPAFEPDAPLRADRESPAALEPLRVDDSGELAALRSRLAALEEAVAALTKRHAASLEELAPLMELAQRAREAKAGPARGAANEGAAIATLRNSISAQAQTQASGRIDTDNDGTGEYGGFLEMSGATEGRMERVLVPPVLSGAFRKMPEGVVVRNGYCYRIFLPDGRGGGIAEPVSGFANDGSIAADLAETTWCCYAWPVEYGTTGTRTFFTNQMGDTVATEDSRYSGASGGPHAGAAFHPRTGAAITGAVAIGTKGNDGNVWRHVN